MELFLYQLYFYVPAAHAEEVKKAVFSAGAGRIGDYRDCCWQTEGTGQYRPQEGSQPFAGETGKLSHEDELKIELVCGEQHRDAVRSALLDAHPYEEVAYGFIKIEL